MNIEKTLRRKQNPEGAPEESRLETPATVNDNELPLVANDNRTQALEAQAQQLHQEDLGKANDLLTRMRERYGDKFAEEMSLQSGDRVLYEGEEYVVDNPGREVQQPLVEDPQLGLQEKQMDIGLAAGAGGEEHPWGPGIGGSGIQPGSERKHREAYQEDSQREAIAAFDRTPVTLRGAEDGKFETVRSRTQLRKLDKPAEPIVKKKPGLWSRIFS